MYLTFKNQHGHPTAVDTHKIFSIYADHYCTDNDECVEVYGIEVHISIMDCVYHIGLVANAKKELDDSVLMKFIPKFFNWLKENANQCSEEEEEFHTVNIYDFWESFRKAMGI